ncbi:MAG: amidophosphoribosyltransferase [Candidatus Saccharimonadales bacterium]|jgi:amidophosphoribosyltransferase
MAGELQEKCAVVGAYEVNAGVDAALALQYMENRGSGATGIGGISDEGKFRLIRETGSAGDVWDDERIALIAAWGLQAAVGHNRYATSGRTGAHHQPAEYGAGDSQILLGHNGNLSDTRQLALDCVLRGIDIVGINDSELKTRAIADRIENGASLPDAVADVYPLLVGAFSSVAVAKGADGEPILTAFRDRHGVRPLALGKTAGGLIVASETKGLEAAGAGYIRDIRPGEMVTITPNGLESRQLADPDPKFDMFELIYFSRPDSKFKGIPIAEIRRLMGRQLGVESHDMVDKDTLVVGVPASAVPFGEGFAEQVGCEYQQFITKNPEIGRTFMAPTQDMREALRELKYLFDWDAIQGRDIAVVDDSIVRNNTGRFIVQKLLANGARSVSMFSGSPPIRFPNFYGIDTPAQVDLVAANLDIESIREAIGAKQLGYLSIDGMMQAVYGATGEPRENFELSCFTGDYPIGVDPALYSLIKTPVSMEFAK